jgi:hypothetical protein
VEMKEKIGVLENVVRALSVQENLVLGWTVGVSFCDAHVEALTIGTQSSIFKNPDLLHHLHISRPPSQCMDRLRTQQGYLMPLD